MRKIEHWVEEVLGLQTETQENIFLSVVVLLGLWLLSRLLLKIASRRETDSRKLYRWRKTTNYIVTGLGIVLLVNIWFNGFQSIATFLGLLSAGLVLALKEPIMNMAGWAFLIWKRPLRIGDRIEIDGYKGDVIDIRLFQFTLNEIHNWVNADQATGRVVHIPNGQIFTRPQANYSYGFPFIWNELHVRITFESDWQEAKAILIEIANKYSEELSEDAQLRIKRETQRHLIFYKDFKPKLYTEVREFGIEITVRYLCNLSRRRESENLIWEDILTNFIASPDIQFAYPTTRFYQAPGDQTQSTADK
ncbi:mechanosensitive ion channel family protein [Pontibacter silvestris]|uniref:Mechanosensitive ion channel family protein n=2 Tax=Pontibacter silvestris TaxID=2305183 RepID=A0ABW4WYA9_9BACT